MLCRGLGARACPTSQPFLVVFWARVEVSPSQQGTYNPLGPAASSRKDKEAILHMLRNIPVPKLRGLCFSSAEVQRWRARMFLLRLSAKAAALAHTSSTPHLQPCLCCPLLPEE